MGEQDVVSDAKQPTDDSTKLRVVSVPSRESADPDFAHEIVGSIWRSSEQVGVNPRSVQRHQFFKTSGVYQRPLDQVSIRSHSAAILGTNEPSHTYCPQRSKRSPRTSMATDIGDDRGSIPPERSRIGRTDDSVCARSPPPVPRWVYDESRPSRRACHR